MGSKLEQHYKELNAELVENVQRMRIEVSLYRKELIALKHENMALREERTLQAARLREDNIAIVKSLMLRLNIDPECLTVSTQTTEGESKSAEAGFVVTRRGQNRRSSKEICQEMRQSSVLARSSRTISPTRRSDSLPPEPNDEPQLTEQLNEEPRLTHTPPPRRAAVIALDSSTEEEEEQAYTSATAGEEQASTSAAQKEQQPQQRRSNENLCTISEDSFGETSPSDSSSTVTCDSSFENCSWSRQALRSIDPNVLGGGMQTRAKSKSALSLALDQDHSTDEQPTIQIPRLLVTEPSPPLVETLRLSSSFDATILSPRRSTFRMSGTNTSTPIGNRSSPQTQSATTRRSQLVVKLQKLKLEHKDADKTRSEEIAETRRFQPTIRLHTIALMPKEEQTTDLSTTCCSSSKRPSRKCRPTELSEPSLKNKMRNTTKN